MQQPWTWRVATSVLIMGVGLGVGWQATRRAEAASTCHTHGVTRTFLQPWSEGAERSLTLHNIREKQQILR